MRLTVRSWGVGLALLLMAGLILISAPAGAQEKVAAEATRLASEIAKISAFTGEVRVRNRMEWLPVTEVGHPLFSGDKVVTKKGRAEVTFEDGSVIRLGLNASVKITEKTEVKGLLFRRSLTRRAIRVALGKVWFRIKPMEGKTTTLRTPTMSAGIRGTEGILSADPEGESTWGLVEGAADTVGAYSEPASYEAPDTEATPGELPESDPACEATAISRASDEAIRAREVAEGLRREAAELEERAVELEERAERERTLESRMAASAARLEANRARIEAAMSGVSSKGVSTREAMQEALTMREEENAARTWAVVEQVESFLDAVQAEQEKGLAAETVILGRSDEHLLRGGVAFSNSVAKMAKVCENAAWAFANVGNASSEGDAAAEAGALEYAGNAQAFSDRGQRLTSRGQQMLSEMAAVRESMLRRSLHAGTLPMYVAQAEQLGQAMALLEALLALDASLDPLVGASGLNAVGASSAAGGQMGQDLADLISAVNQTANQAADATEAAADAAAAGDMVALDAALSGLQSAVSTFQQIAGILSEGLDDPTAVHAVLRAHVRELIAEIVTEVIPEVVEPALVEPALRDGFFDECLDNNPNCLQEWLACGDDPDCLARVAGIGDSPEEEEDVVWTPPAEGEGTVSPFEP